MNNQIIRVVLFSLTHLVFCRAASPFGERIFYPASAQRPSAERIRPDNRLEGVRAKVLDMVGKENISSIAVAVAENGKIIWEEAFGWANREKRIKATPHTPYSIASISKPLTSTGLMVLVEKGRIDLDEPMNRYIGPVKLRAYEGQASNATVKRILRHTSGLPVHWNYFYQNDSFQPPAMEESIRRYGILVFAPGEIYQYSNLGYGIVGFAIARITGKSYGEFMRSEVFLPLGMENTYVGTGGLRDFAAQRYEKDLSPVPFYEFGHPAASAVFSSAHDLIRFGMFHLKCRLPGQRRIITDESIDLMRNDEDPEYPGNEYRLGFRVIEDDCGYRSVSHAGGMIGVSTEIKLVPSEKIALVVLCNHRDPGIYSLDNEILAALLPVYAENMKRRAEDTENPAPETFSPPPCLLGEWGGEIKTYESIQPIQITFRENGDARVKLEDRMETLLKDIRFDDGILSGSFTGEIKTRDAARRPHVIDLRLKLRSKERMSGYANADSDRWFSLGSWINLRKTIPKAGSMK